MIHLDRKHFDDKCEELISDIEDKKARSSAWVWIACGGLVGFALSCIRFTNKKVMPLMAGEIKEKETTGGKFNGKWDYKKGRRNGKA
jgi:hypothetical protein